MKKRRELIYERHRPLTKKTPGPTARARATRRRKEARVAAKVRALCVERDGYCRVGKDMWDFILMHEGRVSRTYLCDGPSEWAHLGKKRRARTRGQAPEQRHTTTDSLMLCRFHHDAYDGRVLPRLGIEPLGSAGADGPLQCAVIT